MPGPEEIRRSNVPVFLTTDKLTLELKKAFVSYRDTGILTKIHRDLFEVLKSLDETVEAENLKSYFDSLISKGEDLKL